MRQPKPFIVLQPVAARISQHRCSPSTPIPCGRDHRSRRQGDRPVIPPTKNGLQGRDFPLKDEPSDDRRSMYPQARPAKLPVSRLPRFDVLPRIVLRFERYAGRLDSSQWSTSSSTHQVTPRYRGLLFRDGG